MGISAAAEGNQQSPKTESSCGGEGNWVVGVKEGRGDEHSVLIATNELLNTASETQDILCAG